MKKQIPIRLLNEGTDVWRYVDANLQEDGSYVVCEQEIPEDEEWEFKPGEVVTDDMIGEIIMNSDNTSIVERMNVYLFRQKYGDLMKVLEERSQTKGKGVMVQLENIPDSEYKPLTLEFIIGEEDGLYDDVRRFEEWRETGRDIISQLHGIPAGLLGKEDLNNV